MNKHSKQAALAVGMLAALTLAVETKAQTADPLLNALIKKGVLTEKEAKEVQTEVKDAKEAVTAPKFLQVNSNFKNLELYGDVRVRYEYRSAQTSSGDTLARERERYAYRLGLKGDLFEDFYYGMRLDSSANSRSTWVTFGDEKIAGGGASSSAGSGPSGKGNDGIFIGQAYAGWHPTEWLDLTLGRMPNPLYTTSMVFDPDINPEGAAERVKFTTGKLELFGNFGQFVYQAVDPANPAPGVYGGVANLSDSFLLAWQLGAKYQVNKDISVKMGPALYNYTGHGQNSGFNGVFVGQGAAGANINGFGNFIDNETGINDLLVFDLPAQVDFRIGHYNARVFGDFAYNINGGQRAKAAGAAGAFKAQTGEDKAYQVGFAFGNNVDLVNGAHPKKNTWESRVYWQHVEQYAVDVNLTDSDFMEGRGNLEGIYTAFSYALSANAIATVRYGYADRINKSLGTGGSNLDLPWINPVTKYQVLQLDFTLKF